MKRMLLYFGSFNPIHNGHIALAEYAVEHDLCDEVAFVVSPHSPHKEVHELAPDMDRFEMVEIACTQSKYPDRIKASAIEFVLPRPSYTIDTLRYLKENFSLQMHFSILMGSDQIAHLDNWKEYQGLFDYPIWIYPRQGAPANRFTNHFTLLTDAPLQTISSTDVRERIARGEDTASLLPEGIADYIRRKGLWSPSSRIEALTTQLDAQPNDPVLLIERGKLHFRLNAWGAALNDFNRILTLDASHAEARQLADMVQEILEFRYKDIYNP